MISWPSKASAEPGQPRYRLVALDLDGVLQPDSTLHPADVAAIRTAHSVGIKVALVSAMAAQAMHRYWAQLGLGTPVIALNGALLYDYPTHRHVAGQPIDPDTLRRALQMVPKVAPKASVGLECCDAWVTNRLGTVADWQIKKTGVWPASIGSLEACLKQPVYQAWVDTGKAHIEQLEERLSGEALSLMRYTAPHMLLMRSPSASRGWALSALASHLEILPHEVIAIGDGGLDRSMLQAAAFSVIVSDMQQEAESAGDEGVTQTSGVAEAFSRYLNLEGIDDAPWPSVER